MNDKLAAWAHKNFIVHPTTRRGGKVTQDSLVNVTKSNGNGNRHIVRISLHRKVMKQLGWIHGDQIKTEINNDGAFILTRCASGGRTIGPSGSKDSGGTRSYIRLVVVKEFYDCIIPGTGKNVEIEYGAIAFEL